ncbi:hypothetical protein NEMBOFW57_005503 [Staphylotrichum longicolle]|uniref:Ca2+ regulator and membrane fusion protein Fig1-domain-containing protein n=1 Tax=Staphylotrichum longicolle TaxID=669026 RepID=A0AAD4I0C5_9PEZI|nr:hypothetical protein NEMBOFW57_005503 [Staphylotrichum longicolle]
MFLIKLAKAYFKPSGLLRLAPYLLIVPIIVFYGCVSTSPAIPNIYLVSLRSNTNGTETPLQVRIGYFGVCGIDADGTRCQAATGRSVETLASALFPSPQNTSSPTNNSNSNSTAFPLNRGQVTDLISTALDLQSSTFTPVLAAAGVLFVLSLAALFVLKRDVQSPSAWERPRRSALVRRVTYGLLFGSSALVFAAALATSQAAGALEYASKGMSHASVLIKAGTTMQVLQWVAFGFEVLFAGAVPLLVRYKAPAEEEYKGEA